MNPFDSSIFPLNDAEVQQCIRGANSVFVTTQQNLARGRVNQVVVEEAQDAPMNATLLVNSYSILIIP
jgi:hypothetical protein